MTRYHTMSILKITAVVFFVGGIVGYSLFNSRIFIAGPQIEVLEPKNGSLIEENRLIQVSGLAKNIAYLRLNGRQIYTNENEIFEEALLLNPGYNIIQIKAEDKFGRNVMREIEIVYAGESVDMTDITETIEIEQASLETSTSTTTSSDSESLEEI